MSTSTPLFSRAFFLAITVSAAASPLQAVQYSMVLRKSLASVPAEIPWPLTGGGEWHNS